jgi:hypothetical protein
MNRRGFFALLAKSAAAVALAPYLPTTRTMTGIFASTPPRVATGVLLPQRMMMARIRITAEAIADAKGGGRGAFVQAMRRSTSLEFPR